MLEKNKDYVEFTLQCTTVERSRDKDYREVCFNGYSDANFPGVPMDVVCKEFDHKVVVVGKRDFERLQAENEQLKKKETFSRDRWKFWKDSYEALDKLVGFSSVEEIQNYLTNGAECDTLHEAISKLHDQVKYTCDEWYGANSRNNSWKVAAECNSPKELIEKREALEKEIDVYSRALQEWKEITGYPSPSAVKTALESGASWCHAYNEIKKANEKLADDVKSWKNVTGYSTPEDYMHARLNNTTPFDYTAAWQKATGCDTPDKAKERIKALNERIDESEADYNHLLCTTGFESEGEIEDALDKCDHSTLRKALVDYEFDHEALLKLTGYKTEQDIRMLLNNSEQFVYKDMRELINSLKRKAKFTESGWQGATGCKYPAEARILIEKWKVLTKCETPEAAATWITSYESACERGNRLAQDIEAWQKATGCDTPEAAETTIRNLRGRIDEMKGFAAIASNWTDRIVED